MTWRDTLYNLPAIRRLLGPAYVWWKSRRFGGSEQYWRDRYQRGGNSGEGSYGPLARFKADTINAWWEQWSMGAAIEFGCGDGHQLTWMRYSDYLGLDVSQAAIDGCRARFADDASRRFLLVDAYAGEQADTSLSLDVIYHLVEDAVYEAYMRRLFEAARRWVIIYSSDTEEQGAVQGPHVRHRRFSAWVEQHQPEWELVQRVDNPYPDCGDPRKGSSADMFLYRRRQG
jgi:SAM-dependent methyltransferase